MQTAKRRRTTWAIVASLMAHAVVLGVAAVQSPTLLMPQEDAGPPEAIIPILLMPRAPPPAPGAQAPSPIRLHQRAMRTPLTDLPVAPLPIPQTPLTPVPPPPPAGPVVITPTPAEVQQRTDVRAALQGLVGCRDPDASGLTRDQRAKCQQRLAAGAKDAPYIGPAITSEKRQTLDKAAADKDAYNSYRRSPAIPSKPGGDLGDGTATGLGRALGSDRPEAKVPF